MSPRSFIYFMSELSEILNRYKKIYNEKKLIELAKTATIYCNNDIITDDNIYKIRYNIDAIKFMISDHPVKIQLIYDDKKFYIAFIDEKIYKEYGISFDYYFYRKCSIIDPNINRTGMAIFDYINTNGYLLNIL